MTVVNGRTWHSVHARWTKEEKEWNKAVKSLYDGGDWIFTRDEIYVISGVGRAGRTRWDSYRWPKFTRKHRDIIIQVMEAFVNSGDYTKHKANGLSDEDIWQRMMDCAVQEGYYPVWADPIRKPGDPGLYKLFDLDGFVELVARNVRAALSRVQNVADEKYSPTMALFPSVRSKAIAELGGPIHRPALIGGARDLVRLECEKCGNIYASQKRFAMHYSVKHPTPIST